MKKVLSFLLAAVLMVSVIPFGMLDITANAAVGDHQFTEKESNNYMSSANILYKDYTVSGRVYGTDMDYFVFDLTSTSVVTASCVADYSYLLMGILDSDGDVVAAGIPGYTSGGLASDGISVTLSAGRYYLCIFNDPDYKYYTNNYMFYIDWTTTGSSGGSTGGSTGGSIDISNYAESMHFTHTLSQTTYVKAGNLSSPVSAWGYTKATYQRWSNKTPINYTIRLEEMYVGEEADEIVEDENYFNADPTGSQHWILMKFYISNNGSTTLKATDIIYQDRFYTSSGASLAIRGRATLSGDRKGMDVLDVTLYPGSSGYVWFGILPQDNIKVPYIKLYNGYDKEAKFSWLSTTPAEHMKTIGGVECYFDGEEYIPNYTGVCKLGGKAYYYTNGSLNTKVSGFQPCKNDWYYFKGGYAVTSQWQQDSKGWCYLGSDGKMVTSSWIQSGGAWYYINSSGHMVTNTWMQDSKGWVYLGSNGNMVKANWVYHGGAWYYMNASGYMVSNTWMQDSKGWVYLGSNGKMIKSSWIKDGGAWYYLNGSGYMVTNSWMKDSKGWCYLTASGKMATNAWIRDSKGWCYVGASGYCVTNQWMQDSKGWVYLNSEGRMATNCWMKDSKGWCYLGANGYCVTNSWKKDSKGWCYLDKNGRMIINKTVFIKTGWFKFDENGYRVSNRWVYDYGCDGWLYFDSNGEMIQEDWKYIGGYWYFFNEDGHMAQNSYYYIDGQYYYFDYDGHGHLISEDEYYNNNWYNYYY